MGLTDEVRRLVKEVKGMRGEMEKWRKEMGAWRRDAAEIRGWQKDEADACAGAVRSYMQGCMDRGGWPRGRVDHEGNLSGGSEGEEYTLSVDSMESTEEGSGSGSEEEEEEEEN